MYIYIYIYTLLLFIYFHCDGGRQWGPLSVQQVETEETFNLAISSTRIKETGNEVTRGRAKRVCQSSVKFGVNGAVVHSHSIICTTFRPFQTLG